MGVFSESDECCNGGRLSKEYVLTNVVLWPVMHSCITWFHIHK